MLSHPGKTITIYNVAELVGKAAKNIRSGFAASSIWPFNRDVFGEDEFLSSYVSNRPHCSTNDCDTTSDTEDVLIRSSVLSTSIGIENAPEFLSISVALLLLKLFHHYLSAHNKGKILMCKEKKKKDSNFNRHTSKRSYCGKKNAYRKKKKRKLNLKSAKKKIIQCSRSSSEDDADVALCSDEPDISFSGDLDAIDYNTEELQTRDFVLCNFSTEKRRIAMYVGHQSWCEIRSKISTKIVLRWLYVS